MERILNYAPRLSALSAALGLAGGGLAAVFGGWDGGLVTLVIFMGIDYISGLIVAGVFKNSDKSETGALQSRAGWQGLCRKGMTLLMVLIAARLDHVHVTGLGIIRDAVIVAYITNETISIIENAGLMGLPIPAVIQRAVDLLRKKSEEGGGES